MFIYHTQYIFFIKLNEQVFSASGFVGMVGFGGFVGMGASDGLSEQIWNGCFGGNGFHPKDNFFFSFNFFLIDKNLLVGLVIVVVIGCH